MQCNRTWPLVLCSILAVLSGVACAQPAPVLAMAPDQIQSEDAATQAQIIQNLSALVAEQQSTIQLLSDEIRRMNGIQSEQQHSLDKMNERQRDIYRQLETLHTPSLASEPQSVLDTAVKCDYSTVPVSLVPMQAINLVTKNKDYKAAKVAFEAFIQTIQNLALMRMPIIGWLTLF